MTHSLQIKKRPGVISAREVKELQATTWDAREYTASGKSGDPGVLVPKVVLGKTEDTVQGLAGESALIQSLEETLVIRMDMKK